MVNVIKSKINKKLLKPDALWLTVVILLAVGFRFFLMRYRFAVSFDEVNYLKLAMRGTSEGLGHVLHPYWTPLFPFMTALLIKTGFHFELAGRLVSILSGGLLLVPLYGLAKTVFDRRTTRISVLMLAFYPGYAFMGTLAQTESLYTLLGLTGLFLGWLAFSKKRLQYGGLAGLVFGLSYLVRPEGVGFFVVLIGYAVFAARYQLLRNQEKKMWIMIPVVVLGFCITASPYIIYLKKTTGEWTLSAKGKSLQQGEAIVFTGKDQEVEGEIYRQLSEDNTQTLIDQMFHTGDFLQQQRKRGEAPIRITPGLLLNKYLHNLDDVINEVIPRVLSAPVFLLMILGLFGEGWSKKNLWIQLYLLGFLIFFWFLIVPLFHITERYFVAFIPLCFIWVGRGVMVLSGWLHSLLHNWKFTDKKRIEILSKTLFFLLIFAVIYCGGFVKIVVRSPLSTEYIGDPVEQKTAGHWLKTFGKETPVIMSRNHAVDLYAGNDRIEESVTIPQNSLNRVLAYARYRGVDYLVITSRYLTDYPRLAPLLDGEAVPDQLSLVYQRTGPPGIQTVIYRLKKDGVK